jgi:NACHT domain
MPKQARSRPAAGRPALLAASLALLTSVYAVVVNIATDLISDTWAWAQNPWLIWGLVALLALVTAVLAVRSQRSAAGDLPLPEVADQLAVEVQVQWLAEAAHRRLNDPYALPVAWVPADPDVVEDWAAITTSAQSWPGDPPTPTRWAAGPAGLAGRGGNLAAVLAGVPTGRLVVLGEAGAGKTMLLVRLLLDLLARRNPSGPVPVLLPLAAWNPDEQDLHAWIAERLILDHPRLAAPAAGGDSRVQALLDRRLLLPILDGLDELPEARRGVALARINQALRPWEGVVVASRLAAWRQAVQPPNDAPVWLRGAAGITLAALDPGDVAAWLGETRVASRRRPAGRRWWPLSAPAARSGRPCAARFWLGWPVRSTIPALASTWAPCPTRPSCVTRRSSQPPTR